MLIVHAKRGFFASEGGIELVLLLCAGAAALALTGPGALALDSVVKWPPRERSLVNA
ncbi:MAG: hypothetical protein HY703_12765 [Gemmatimonadetes bacterium]|nr:hypothetical protein [Gemmatimonadota bacterium]